jgi:hypothetical protein
LTGSKSLVFGIELPATLHLCFVACGPAVFDAAVDICADVDVVWKVASGGLIDFLVAVAALTSLGVRRAAIMA